SLAEVRDAGGPDWLPADGFLYFFFDAEQRSWGFDPAGAGSTYVVHLPEFDATGTRASPPQVEKLLERRMRFARHQSLPSPEKLHRAAWLRLSEADDEALMSLRREPFGDAPAHKLGGFADAIQNDDMELQSEMAANGINSGSPEGYSDPRVPQLRFSAESWRL